jgi:hypothetical protein
MSTQLIDNGAVIAWALVGLVALLGLGFIQLLRRRSDLKRARIAVRLASYSITKPRLGPIAIAGRIRDRTIDCTGQLVALDGTLDIVCGSRARWRQGTRRYTVRDGDEVYAIGIMSKGDDDGWRLKASAGESGVQVFAVKPTAAPKPLLPWRAPLILAVWGAIGYFGLYGIGTLLLDVPAASACLDNSRLRFELATALPEVRDEALARYRALDSCHAQ